MSTPTNPTPTLQHLPMAAIVASRTNPRQQFNPERMAELTASIKASGVHQPILVRPLPASRLQDTAEQRNPGQPLPTYELVAGERRWRASQAAGLADIPAMVRPLTDSQVLEIQIVENLQRDDLTELEEAEGYHTLMHSTGQTAQQVGDKIGKSRTYVYNRLKLMDACATVRAGLRAGTIDASRALLLARIPSEKLQIEALRRLAGDEYHQVSHREALRIVQQEYMVRLDRAAFDIADATLCPQAGPCSTCPKRTSADPDLFADHTGPDTCLDPTCYQAKTTAHEQALLSAAQAAGATVLTGREAKAVIPNQYGSVADGWLRLDNPSDCPGYKTTLRKLLGKRLLPSMVTLVLPSGATSPVACIPRPQALALLDEVHNDKADEAKATLQAEQARLQQRAKDEAKRDRKEAYEKTWRLDLLTAIWQQLQTARPAAEPEGQWCPADVLRHVASTYANRLNETRATRLAKLLGLGKVAPGAGVAQWAATTPDPGAAVMLLVAEADAEYRPWLPDAEQANNGLLLVAAELGLDVPAIQAQTQANQRSAEAQKPAPATTAAEAAGTISPPGPAAQAHGVRGDAKAKAKPGKARATPAGAGAPRLSAQEAQRGIAAAMQGQEAGPVDGAEAPSQGQTEAQASTSTAAPPLPLAPGRRVRIKSAEHLPKHQAKWAGKEGTVGNKLGDRAWMVTLPGKRGVAALTTSVSFDPTELEVLA